MQVLLPALPMKLCQDVQWCLLAQLYLKQLETGSFVLQLSRSKLVYLWPKPVFDLRT